MAILPRLIAFAQYEREVIADRLRDNVAAATYYLCEQDTKRVVSTCPVKRVNERPFRKLPGYRRSQFEALDRPALGRLPEYAPYEFAQ